MKNLSFALLLWVLTVVGAFAQNLAGTKWKTIDDKTGKPRSIVELYEKDGKLYGKIIQGFDADAASRVCTACKDDRKGQKVVGMEIIRGLKKDGDKWEDGEILDPDEGKTYDCKIWVEDGKLKVRGYIAFFFRTQTWEKAN